MIKFETYRLLNESLGMHSLGVRPVQSMGIQSNMPGFGEAGLPPEISAKGKGKPPFGKPPFGGGDEDPMAGGQPPMGDDDEMGHDDMGDHDDMGGDDDMDHDEMGGEEGDEGSVEDRIAELEAELAALKAEIGGDKDADLDHADDLGDIGDEGDDHDGEGNEEMGDEGDDEDKPNPFGGKGKKPVTPFMKKGMKSEAKSEEGKMEKGGGAGPVFMMKKKCGDGSMDKNKLVLGKSKKGCSKGCKKCAANMKKNLKKESSGYERPQPLDFSENAWLKSIHNQLAQQDVGQKFDDGMRKFTNEDLLIAPIGGGLEAVPEPKAGEPGFAPQGAVGGDLGFTTEAIADIMARLKRLENN